MKFAICLIALFAVAMAGTTTTLAPLTRPMNPFVDFFVGFIDGMKDSFNTDVTNVQECINSPVKIWNQILDFVDYIKHIDWKNFDIGEFFQNVIGFFQDVVMDLYPCLIIAMAIDKIVELILNPTIDTLQKVLLQTLMANIMALIQIVQNLVQDIIDFNSHDIGYDLSSIIYIIILH